MELRYLEIFCKVVECGSFSKAAEALHLTQPTVSIHIKALEDELKTVLLDRLGRKAIPTRAGELLYGYARNIVRLKDEARQALDQMGGTIRGGLTVGASTIPGEYILPDLLQRFKEIYPGVYPCLKIGDTKDIVGLVLQGGADAGVIGAHAADRSLSVHEFLDDELTLVAPPSFGKDVITKKELSKVPLLMREEGSGTRASLEEALEGSGIDPKGLDIAGEVGSTEALKRSVIAGMGLSFVSRPAVEDSIRLGLLREVKVAGLRIRRHFYVITHRMRHGSPVSRAFVEFLLAVNKGSQ